MEIDGEEREHLGGRQKPDFIANVTYLPTEQSGRKTSAGSKYRPIIEFPGYERMTSGEQIFMDKDIVYPGETTRAQIRIASVDYFEGKLFIGQKFRFFEVPAKTFGTGEILEIVNKDLQKS